MRLRDLFDGMSTIRLTGLELARLARCGSLHQRRQLVVEDTPGRRSPARAGAGYRGRMWAGSPGRPGDEVGAFPGPVSAGSWFAHQVLGPPVPSHLDRASGVSVAWRVWEWVAGQAVMRLGVGFQRWSEQARRRGSGARTRACVLLVVGPARKQKSPHLAGLEGLHPAINPGGQSTKPDWT